MADHVVQHAKAAAHFFHPDAFVVAARGLVVGSELVQGAGLVTQGAADALEETGCTVDDAVRAAQDRGYAEADPSTDLDGHDARARMTAGVEIDIPTVSRSARYAMDAW